MVFSFDVFCKSGRKGVFHFEEPYHFSMLEYWLGSNFLGQPSMVIKNNLLKKIFMFCWKKDLEKSNTYKITFIGKSVDFFYIEI